nr:hypothetical protein Iba_chr01bCG1250 [Ipomoea batatas]
MHENRAPVLVFSGLVDRGMVFRRHVGALSFPAKGSFACWIVLVRDAGNCVVLDVEFSGIFGPFPVIYDGVMELGLDWRLKKTRDWNSDQLLEVLAAADKYFVGYSGERKPSDERHQFSTMVLDSLPANGTSLKVGHVSHLFLKI